MFIPGERVRFVSTSYIRKDFQGLEVTFLKYLVGHNTCQIKYDDKKDQQKFTCMIFSTYLEKIDEPLNKDVWEFE